MALLSSPMKLHGLLGSPSSLQPIAPKPLRLTSRSRAARIRSALNMDFPYLPPAHRDLVSDLLSSLDSHLPLLPPSSPLLFQNSSGSSKGSLRIAPGTPSSPVDLAFSSWLHCELPSGVLDIATLSSFLRSTATDAPHLLIEFIQSGPKNMVVIMDLLARRDLVLHPNYLAHFYEETQLGKSRQQLDECPQVRPYSSPFVQSMLSPTAVAVSIVCEEEGELEEVVGAHVGVAARDVVRVWLERCVGEEREVAEGEVEELRSRDNLIKKKAIEMDLTANLPRLFGEDVALGVVEVVQKAFGV